ncbi:hypothetical protein [Marisediminicola antarctica]|uniref:hypothetical protein n=1 Tax=Marisediminicola antarctica TaxID=674079 RepID=UPI001F4214E8|nr:hypothetical protein [Marisediminicola antarctica]
MPPSCASRRRAERVRRRSSAAQACVDAIEGLNGSDRAVAELLHVIVAEEAAHLDAKTWYSFPSYARDGKVVVFFQPKSKFDTRYGSIGFTEDALLDDGVVWPTSFAVVEVTDAVDKQLRALVKKAAS